MFHSSRSILYQFISMHSRTLPLSAVAKSPAAARFPRFAVFFATNKPAILAAANPLAGNESKYSVAQTETILRAINTNDLFRYEISKGRAEKVKQWKSINGPFESVEQLLDLDGFGYKILDKFVQSILSNEAELMSRPPAEEIATKQVEAAAAVPVLPRSQQFTTPLLHDSLRKSLSTFTAIHVGLGSVTWTQLQLRTTDVPSSWTVSDWTSRPIPTERKMPLSELNDCLLNIAHAIPTSDVYLLESPRTAQPSPQGSPAQININVQLSQTIAMIATIMAIRSFVPDGADKEVNVAAANSSSDIKRLLFMRQYLSSRLYQTIVGTERVSSERIVSELIRRKSSENSLSSDGELLNVSADLKRAYGLTKGHEKEYMGQSLLMALTFLRLCVVQCPKSLSFLRTKKIK